MHVCILPVSYLDHISRNVTVAFLDAARNVQRLIWWNRLTAFPMTHITAYALRDILAMITCSLCVEVIWRQT